MVKQERRRKTEESLIKAVGALIQTDGVEALGVNAVARHADVDKVLIYRYFDGLDGLLEAYATSRDVWPEVEDVLGVALKRWRLMQDAPRLLRGILEMYHTELGARPVTLEILAYERVGTNVLTRTLAHVRKEWTEALRARLKEEQVPVTEDAFVLIEVFRASIHDMLLRDEDPTLTTTIDATTPEGSDLLFDIIEATLRRGATAFIAPSS